ncbi:Nse1 non-SMC component of SMC5-6 complex-domain-containing protein [Globomyces pollinis-pini]|nr:Nse1 non-SMC component of SMC5-6 complex-domain-containing protein [Globomyces pollinis-pini]
MTESEYNNNHRLFLQLMMSKKELDIETAKQEFSKLVLSNSEGNQDFLSFIRIINDQLNLVDLQLRNSIHPITGIVYLVFVNRNSDEISKLATHYNANEINYFRLIVNTVVESDKFKISVNSALNLTSRLEPSIPSSAGEIAVNKFIDDLWLLERNGYLSLSTRTLVELELYMIQKYEEFIITCQICKENIWNEFVRCKSKKCEVKVHRYCFSKLATRNQGPKCPGCQSVWSRHSEENNSQSSDEVEMEPSQESRNSTPASSQSTPNARNKSQRTQADAQVIRTRTLEEAFTPSSSNRTQPRKRSARNRIESDSE